MRATRILLFINADFIIYFRFSFAEIEDSMKSMQSICGRFASLPSLHSSAPSVTFRGDKGLVFNTLRAN